MALSGKISNAYRGWTYQIEWSAKQSIENNTSTITCVHKLICDAEYGLYIGARDNTCTVDGVQKTFTSPAISTEGGTTHTLGTTTHTVTHNDNGSKSCAISGYFYVEATLTGVWKQYFSTSGTITLDTIARASQPSCITWPDNTQDVGEFGDAISIHMNRKSDAFTHTVRYQFGSKSGTIATGVTTGTTWTIPLSLMDLIPAATSGSGTIYVDTYNGSTLVGTKYCGFTATVPASVKPTCSFVLEDITGIDDIYGSPVKGLSKIKITVSTEEAYSSPIVSCKITANGVTYTASEATTGVLKTAGTSRVTATVTDKRGRTGSVSYDMNVQDYTAPSVTALSVRRCTEDGTTSDQGDYVKVTFSAVVSSMSSKNTATYTLKYKKSADSAYTTVSLSALKNKYSVSDHSYIFAADGGTSYAVVVTVADRHSSANRATTASTAFTLMNWNKSGKGIAFGKVSEKNAAEFAMDMYDKYETIIGNGKASYTGSGDNAIDPNTTIEHLILTNINVPSAGWWYIMTIFYSGKSASTNRVQLALPYNTLTRPAYRNYYSGAWSEWATL